MEIERIKEQWGNYWNAATVFKEISSCENHELLPVFKKYLSKNELIIEGGAGLGKWVVFLSNLGYKMIGVEVVEECVKSVKDAFPDVDMRVGDILDLKFSDNTFGAYISQGVIEHFYDGPDAAVKEAFRVLKPNGTFIVTVPAMNIIRTILYPMQKRLLPLKEINFFRRIFGKQVLSVNRKKNHEQPWSKIPSGNLYPIFHIHPTEGRLFFEYQIPLQSLRECLVQNGFEIMELKPIGHKQGIMEDFVYPFFNVEKIESSDNIVKYFAKNAAKFLSRLNPYICNHQYLCVAKKIVKH